MTTEITSNTELDRPADGPLINLVLQHHGNLKSDRWQWLDTLDGYLGIVPSLIMAVLIGGYLKSQQSLIAPALLVVMVPFWVLGSRIARRIGTRARRVRDNAFTKQAHGQPGSRLKCSGEAEELEPLQAIEPRFFEPAIFCSPRLGGPLRGSWKPSGLWIVIGSYILFFVLFWRYAPIPSAMKAAVLILASIPTTLVGSYWPRAYFRITPGRLEVLKARSIAKTVRRIAEFDLTTARIICSYRWQRVEIGKRNDEDPYRISLLCMKDSHRFVETLFTAAVSPKTGIELPENQLLG